MNRARQIKDEWYNYLLETTNKEMFIEKLKETPKHFFFVEMKNEEEVVRYAEENGLENKLGILNELEKNTIVSEKNVMKSWKFNDIEREFMNFLWTNYHLSNHRLSDHLENEILIDMIYTDTVFDDELREPTLSSSRNNELLKGVILKRVDEKIVGFTKVMYDPKEKDNIYIKYLFVGVGNRRNGYSKGMIKDVMYVYKFKRYLAHAARELSQNIFESLGFEWTIDSDDRVIMIKEEPNNENRMKIITNGHQNMKEKTFLKAIKGMDELEWRTNPTIIKLVEKRKREIIYLQKLNKRTSKQSDRLFDLKKFNRNWKDLSISEVDISRKWLLTEYDSATSIGYLEEKSRFINFVGLN